MDNLFSKLEEEIAFRDDICFDDEKIKEFILNKVRGIIENSQNKGFSFEEIVYGFLDI